MLGPSPTPQLKCPRYRFLNNHRGRTGWLERRSDLSNAPPPAPDETFTAVLHHHGPNSPDESVLFLGVVCRVVLKNSLAVFLIAQPNGARLSCGAERERSQTEDYLRKRGAGSFRRLLGTRGRNSSLSILPYHRSPFPHPPICDNSVANIGIVACELLDNVRR